jgi:hypothetical protein
MENAGFLSNRDDAIRKLYSLQPPIRELLNDDLERGCEILDRTLRKLTTYPNANKAALFVGVKREYELENNVSFASPFGGPLDQMERRILDPSNQIGKVLRKTPIWMDDHPKETK